MGISNQEQSKLNSDSKLIENKINQGGIILGAPQRVGTLNQHPESLRIGQRPSN